MISIIEMEEIAVLFGNPYTQSLSVYQRDRHLVRVEEARGIELTPDERKAVMERADEHRATRTEGRPVAPAMQATILPFRLDQTNTMRRKV